LYSFCNGTASRGSNNGQERAVLRLADLSNNKIETDNIRRIKLTDAEFLSHQLRKDDMVFIRVNGSKDRVATAFHYTSEEIISYCDHLFCGNRCSTLIAPDYVMLAFNSPYTRKQLTPEIKTSAGQNTISQGSMAKIILPLPPIEEQKRIVARVEELLAFCDQLK
jgi:type I restriction enzyme S subunit